MANIGIGDDIIVMLQFYGASGDLPRHVVATAAEALQAVPASVLVQDLGVSLKKAQPTTALLPAPLA